MWGNLERDSKGNILCDCCGKHKAVTVCKTSMLARWFIKAPSSERKLFHFCIACARAFSTLAQGKVAL